MAHQSSWPAVEAKLKAFHPPTLEDLQKYSAANLDPWTVQLGECLCDDFKFAPLGHRNLADVFTNLAGDQFREQDFEIGFGTRHVLHLLLRTSEGFSLAAIVGILAECFHEDLIVDFFISLARNSGVPVSLRPLEVQWARMVKVLYGVLATSTFGQLLVSAEDVKVDIGASFDVHTLINVLSTMSHTMLRQEKGVVVECDAELTFLAAAATWLFDMKYVILAGGNVVRANQPSANQNEAAIVFDTSLAKKEDSVSTAIAPPHYRYPMFLYTMGGRVSYEHLFKLTFDSAFTNIKDDLLSTYLFCGTKIMQENLNSFDHISRFAFLPHDMGPASGSAFGFINTLVGWFPELRRLSPRFDRLSKTSLQEAQSKFRESLELLESSCSCSSCDTTTRVPGTTCVVTLVELILVLGLYVTRMIVHPALYPKVKGIRALYNRLEQSRPSKARDVDPVEDFMARIGRRLPTSVEMLKTGALLFCNSASKEIDAQSGLMGITHAGLTIFLNGGFKDIRSDNASDRDRNPVTVQIVPGWMCLLGHEASLEVYSPGSTGWTFEQSWEQIRRNGHDVRQLLKWQGSVVLSTLMPQNDAKMAQAEAEGWILLC